MRGRRPRRAIRFVFSPVRWLLVAGLLTAVPWLTAGVLIEESQESIFDHGGEKTLTIQIDRDRVLVDVARNDQRTTYIFHGDRGTFWIVDYAEKVYRVASREVVEAFQNYRGETEDAMEARVKAQLETMLPAQRQEIEGNMRDRLSQTSESSSAEPVEIRFKKAGESKAVGTWTCDWYNGFQAKEKVWEVCAVDWPALGVLPEDFSGLDQMIRLLAKFSPRDAHGFLGIGGKKWKKSPGYPGVPVSRVSYREGRMQAFYEVKEVRQQEFPEAAFEPPAGFEQRTLVLLEGALE